ncbi:MAG TPA: TonB-dependent siderophore receptor [Duganella sp.]
MPRTELTAIARALQAGLFGLFVTGAAFASDTPADTPAPQAKAEAEADATLPVVLVKGEQEAPTGPVRGYVATRSATGTKTDTPLMETPQSITVVGAGQIEILKAQNINDAIAYSVGAMRLPYAERTGDEILLRGFSIPTTLRDGTRYQVNRFDGQQEVYGLERIEVLKGAASILYGSAEPGGIVNTVSKRPTPETLRELNVEMGSFSRKQVAGDFAGALTEDGAWSYRLTGLKRDSDTFTDYITDNRTYIAPALKWDISPATSVTFLSEYQRDRTGYGGDGLPLAGTVLPNAHGRLPTNIFIGEPGYDRYETERYSVGYILEHAFGDKLKLKHSLRKYRMEQDWSAISVTGLAADQRTAQRVGQDRVESSARVSSDTSLQYDWQVGGVTHKTLIGVDYSDADWNSGRYRRTAGPLDLYAPVYGGALGPAVPRTGWRSNTKQLGLYAQDQMKFADKWVLLLGGRHDRVRQNDCSYFVPANCYNANQHTNASTGRAGLVYLADNGLAPFVSFSQSFAPVTGLDRLGNRFDPTRGEQFEAGVRYQPANSTMMLSAATYQLTQTNVLSTDPANIQFQLQRGEVRSRGLELEAKGRIGRNAQILSTYTYTDARTTKASPLNPEQVGRRSENVPYNQLSVWGDYSFGDFGLPGLKVGAGARYVGETRSIFQNTPAPDFTVADLMVSYSTGPWRLALNVSNVADKTYVASCPSMCLYGEPRKAIISATYRW